MENINLDPSFTKKVSVVEIEGHGLFAVRGQAPWYLFEVTGAPEGQNGWIITDVPLSCMTAARPQAYNCLMKHHNGRYNAVLFKNQTTADKVVYELNRKL